MMLLKNKGNFEKKLEVFEKYWKNMEGCGRVYNLGVVGILGYYK